MFDLKTINHIVDKYLLPVASSLTGAMICIRCSEYIDIPLPALTAISLLVILLSIKGKIRICLPLLILLFVYGCSLIIHPEPEFQLRIMRFSAFTVGLALFSPLLNTARLTIARKIIGTVIFIVLSVMVAISFMIWLYCLATHREMSDLTFYYYGFKGIFNMGMTLSPAAAIIAIVSLQKLLSAESVFYQLSYLVMTVIGITVCIAAGSRIATTGMAISITTLIILSIDKVKNILKLPIGRISFIVSVICLLTMTPHALDVIIHKNRIGFSHDSVIYSRQEIWQTRIDEIKSSPIIGIGYANEFPRPSWKNQPGKLTYLEPGSSWLSLLSYGGIIGLATFCWFAIILARRIQQNQTSNHSNAIIPLLLFFFIDGIAEGWLMFAGALMFPLFWLTCSYSFAHKIPIKH